MGGRGTWETWPKCNTGMTADFRARAVARMREVIRGSSPGSCKLRWPAHAYGRTPWVCRFDVICTRLYRRADLAHSRLQRSEGGFRCVQRNPRQTRPAGVALSGTLALPDIARDVVVVAAGRHA